jgi:hypothetical protein
MASRIARAWRRHLQIRVFRRLRDVVASNEKSDPASTLRRVNPAEAAVAGDPSCGAHVRFRLGGETFPPDVFYKIYTHRPVTDVCAFAPRDYAASRGSRDGGAAAAAAAAGDRRGWYARVENNTWRRVRDVGALEERENETTAVSARRESIRDAYTFHLSPSARRDATERRRRERRVEWMRQLYGFHASRRGGGGGGSDAGAPRGSGPTRVDADGDDLDVDVDATFETDEERALLNWSAALDFDAYQRTWSTLSCGAPSESTAPRGSRETAIEASARLGVSDANAFGG